MSRSCSQFKDSIARNIRACRMVKFPGRGGAKKCAEAFGVSPQQWSPWEKGHRTPDESRMRELANFFGVTADYLRSEHHGEIASAPEHPKIEKFGVQTGNGNSMFLPELALNMKNNNMKMICTFETVVSEIKFVPLE